MAQKNDPINLCDSEDEQPMRLDQPHNQPEQKPEQEPAPAAADSGDELGDSDSEHPSEDEAENADDCAMIEDAPDNAQGAADDDASMYSDGTPRSEADLLVQITECDLPDEDKVTPETTAELKNPSLYVYTLLWSNNTTSRMNGAELSMRGEAWRQEILEFWKSHKPNSASPIPHRMPKGDTFVGSDLHKYLQEQRDKDEIRRREDQLKNAPEQFLLPGELHPVHEGMLKKRKAHFKGTMQKMPKKTHAELPPENKFKDAQAKQKLLRSVRRYFAMLVAQDGAVANTQSVAAQALQAGLAAAASAKEAAANVV